MLVCQFAGLTLLLGSANLVGQTSMEIPRAEVAAHRTSRTDFIRASGTGGFQGLLLRIEVDRTGSVTSAKVTEGAEKFRAAALAMAQTWRYKPFVRDGRAVPAAFTDFVMILPPERAVRTSKAFPTVQNWDSVKIALKRTACYGGCPVYEVKIDGHGNVLFNGSVGQRRRHISRETLEGLLEVFRRANYFSLDSEYRIGATDLSTCITSISIDGHSMSVLDYGGLQVGMPVSVREAEQAIDEAAGTSDWLLPGPMSSNADRFLASGAG